MTPNAGSCNLDFRVSAVYAGRRVSPVPEPPGADPHAVVVVWEGRAKSPPRPDSSRMRTSAQGFVSCFQRRDRLLPGDTRKRIEKLFKTVVSFEVVDQVAERHARPDKHGRAPQNIRIAVNNRRSVWHVGPSIRQF